MAERKVVIGLVQCQWRADAATHKETLLQGIKKAASQGSQVVFLQELTLHRYFGDKEKNDESVFKLAEELDKGPTAELCKRASAENNVFVVGSIFEKELKDGSVRYFNTAVIYKPDEKGKQGILHAFTRKQHIPKGTGYNEIYYFQPGDSDYPVHDLGFIKLGIPTCYDQWFPELARIYALKGAELLIYPTAIGSEPDFPGFDSRPMWQIMMTSHAIANGLFVGAVNRVGSEGTITFYGSSFVCSPSGRLLGQAPRHEEAVVVATLDFATMNFWRNLFPLLTQRQPQTYNLLVKESV